MSMRKSILPLMAMAAMGMESGMMGFDTSSRVSQKSFTLTYVNGRYSKLDNLKIAKRRAANKVARKSRQINRA